MENNTSSQNTEEPLWDATEVARQLNISRSQVYQWADDDTIPCVRLGRRVRFRPAVIREIKVSGLPANGEASEQ